MSGSTSRATGSTLRITNPLGHQQRPAFPGGNGMNGMRERAKIFGGTFVAGPVDRSSASRRRCRSMVAPMGDGPIRVLIADDQALVRGGFRSILSTQPDIEVVADVADGATAVAATMQHRPDVVLMDIRMPVLDGLARPVRSSNAVRRAC